MAEINKDDYPSNSHRKKVESVVDSPVKVRKKRRTGALAEILYKNGEDLGESILYDSVIPGIRSAILGAFDTLTGNVSSRYDDNHRGRSRVYRNYNSIYDDDRRPGRDRERISREGRSRHRFDEVIYKTRGEAEDVLEVLTDLIDQYHIASVEDFYRASGIESSYTDQRYGWTNLRGARLTRISGGYIIDLPPTEIID